MPIFEYECKRCGSYEEFLMSKAKKNIKCSKCSGRMKKLVSCPPVHFKGSGFYSTDYKKPRNKKVERELDKYNIPH